MIRDHVADTINSSLTPASIANLMKGIVTYIDKNSNILMDMNLAERYSFSDYDRGIVYTAIGVPEAVFEREIAESKYIYSGNKVQSNPFYNAVMLTIHVLLNKGKEKEAQQLLTYTSLMMYTSQHKGFFKYGVNDKIMDYTISNLDSSFRLRNVPSLYAWLDDNSKVTFTTYSDRLKRADDKDLTWVINALWDRIKGKLRKIRNLYYDNYNNGNYLNQDTDSYDEEDYHQMDNNSFMIDRLTTKVYTKLVNHQFDQRFLRYSITRSDTSYAKFKNLIDDIIETDNNHDMKRFISSMIEYFLLMSGKGFEYISRGEYITYMKSAYASNTEMQQMVYIKGQLDRWINENMASMGRQNYGKTAKLGYKKSIYMFFVFIINYEAKSN